MYNAERRLSMPTIEEKVRELPPELQREVDDFIDFLALKHASKARPARDRGRGGRRPVTITALNGKEYTIEPLPEDPAEFTYHASREAILEAIRGESL